ncbi:MAG TPA: hypothetical protein VMI52_09180 [Acetobacteraceae bacterium]|nr:hypothetical protein [Acetobacteraceae bacterium]
MIRVFLIVAGLFVFLLAAGTIYLGAFPPKPHPAPVEHVLPNDRFQTH